MTTSSRSPLHAALLSIAFLSPPAGLTLLPREDAGERGLEVRALANEGFLLVAGEDAVLIDAFLAQPYVGYGALSGEALRELEGATGDFASVDLALASHVHRDHFQGETALRFLTARPECRLVSSPQVVDALRAAATEAGSSLRGESSVRSLLPGPGEEELLEVGDVRVAVLRLSHGTGRFAGIQNLAHVITIGGVTALHVGDAAMEPANFAPYRLRERGIDVVFVPYWYFGDETGMRIVDDHFRPAKLVACHVPPAEFEMIAEELERTQPDVLVPRPLERFEVHGEP